MIQKEGRTMNRIYGYVRVSTMHQKVDRQIENIKKIYPEAVIIAESYTGTSMDRPQWNKLYKQLKPGDTVIFDEVSRMSRNASEGFQVYKELFDKGVNLVFLKESTLNSENFREAMQAKIDLTGTDIDLILAGVNAYLMKLAENQIRTAFETAEHEVDFLHKRISEGVQKAQAEGKRIGTEPGRKLTTKKSIENKEIIRKHAKDFGGTLTDKELMKMTNLARNTYYKYKRQIKEEISE